METEAFTDVKGTVQAASASDIDCITWSCYRFCLPWYLSGTC